MPVLVKLLSDGFGKKGTTLIKLLLGLVLWWAAHFLKRLAPGVRRDLSTALGQGPSKGLISLALLGGAVLIFLGYRDAGLTPVYTPIAGIGYLNNLLMFVALFAMGVGPVGGRLSAKFRHPMLWGLIIWSVAHLMVNGDLASVVMFGGLGLWALIQIRLINQHEGPWERPMPGNALQDYKLVLTTLFIYVVIAGIHWLFDHNPFLGTYG